MIVDRYTRAITIVVAVQLVFFVIFCLVFAQWDSDYKAIGGKKKRNKIRRRPRANECVVRRKLCWVITIAQWSSPPPVVVDKIQIGIGWSAGGWMGQRKKESSESRGGRWRNSSEC